LPVWQQRYQALKERGVEVLSVALDAQGPDKARPYTENSEARFTTVVDEENLLGQLYGFNVVPNGFLIDEGGTVRFARRGGFDIRRDEIAEVLERWIDGPSLDESLDAAKTELGAEHSEAIDLFRAGLVLYREGEVGKAVAEWRSAIELEPGNYIIRKQIWAVQNPDRFYTGDVDYSWQKEQMEQGL